MNRFHQTLIALGIAAVATPGAAHAQVQVTGNIATSTVWTSNNVYSLEEQIYVLPGATLTIEAGTRIESTAGVGGSLAVCKGAQIFVNGTAEAPVVFTSSNDNGTWREAANEWGNLTLMGAAYISEDDSTTNVPTPNPNNVASMEGLVAAFPGDTKVLYGGGNDGDDSGSLSYLSIRYGGKVIGLNNELNGLSLGGIGRGTDIHHVEIMNNVDDGIEIWGGTVNLKYLSIWNVGDDSFDIDQGWRGKAQFGLIVQGWSLDAAQGSGVGDNAIEHDGAEDSDWQPVTTAALYNFTVIGQPVDGDGLTAWRDNARVQHRNGIFMDGGENVVRFDNIDGDGANGYGHNGTLSWADTWTTDWDQYSTVNAPAFPADFYKAQVDGKLAEMTDSVFFRNQSASAYTELFARGGNAASTNNVFPAGFDPADAPVREIVRGAPVVKGGKTMLRVEMLDPRPMNEALTSADFAPNDGFFTSGGYFRGAFDPGNPTWLHGWSAADEFGMLADAPIVVELRLPNGIPAANLVVTGFGTSTPTATVVVRFGALAGQVIADEVPISVSGATYSFTTDTGLPVTLQGGAGFSWSAGPYFGSVRPVYLP